MLSIIVYQLGLSKLISVIAVRYVVPSSLIDDQLFYRPFRLRTRFSVFVSFWKGTQKFFCFLRKIFHNSTSDSWCQARWGRARVDGERFCAIWCISVNPHKPTRITHIRQRVLDADEKNVYGERKCSARSLEHIASFESSPHLYALTCYMRLRSGNLFPSFSVSIVVAASLFHPRSKTKSKSMLSRRKEEKKIKVRAEKNLNGKKCFFIIFSGVASRAWWEKSRLEFFFIHFITISSQLWFSNCQLLSVAHGEQSHFQWVVSVLAKFGVCGLLLIRI